MFVDNNVDVLVVKRRSVFESSTSNEASDKANMNAANRRSGEFSSTFKNRLSTFELTEATNLAVARVTTTPHRDAHFKNKLATFHKVGETTIAPSTSNTLATVQTTEAQDKPNFQAKLAAFRQVEVKTLAKPAVKMNKPAITATKPVIAVSMKPVIRTLAPPALPTHPPVLLETPKTVQVAAIQMEPIYANSSVAMAGSSSGHQRMDAQYSSMDHQHFGAAGDVESYSDCTEDEGIRSLSPHGTPSPTSPTPNGMEPLPPPLPSHPPVGYSPYSFQQQQQRYCLHSFLHRLTRHFNISTFQFVYSEMESEPEIAESSSGSSSVPLQMAWPSAEVQFNT